jgi:hypothetical protein
LSKNELNLETRGDPMSSTIDCRCNECVSGVANQYLLTFSGVTNGAHCTTCGNFGSYVVTWSAGTCGGGGNVSPTVCTVWGGAALSFSFVPGATGGVVGQLQLNGSGKQVVFKSGPLTDCMSTFVMTNTADDANFCFFNNATVTATPIGPAISTLNAFQIPCLPTIQPGTAPGSNLSCWQPPFMGRLTGSVPTAGAGLCGGGNPFAAPPCEITLCNMPSGTVPGWPPATTVPACCPYNCGCGCSSAAPGSCGSSGACGCCGSGGSSGGCGCGCSGAANSSGASSPAPAFEDLIRRLTHVGPGRLNLSNGNLLVQLRMPKGGLFAPTADLYYNSLSPSVTSAFGFGWTNLFQRKLTNISSTSVTLSNGTGSVLSYTGKDSNSRYLPPPGAQNALVKNADGTWTETQVDGLALHYNASGVFDRLKNVAGATWTLTHDSGGKLTAIKDPVSGVTSLVYASNNLRRIVDAAGRIVSFTFVSGNLTQRTNPDGSLEQFLYDVNHRLRTYVDLTFRAGPSATTPTISSVASSRRAASERPIRGSTGTTRRCSTRPASRRRCSTTCRAPSAPWSILKATVRR